MAIKMIEIMLLNISLNVQMLRATCLAPNQNAKAQIWVGGK